MRQVQQDVSDGSDAMKIGIFGDTHFTDVKPSARTDADFFSTQLFKLDWAIELFRRKKVELIGQCGDLLDTRRVSNRVYVALVERLIALKDAGIPVVCTLGQHDVLGKNIQEYSEHSDLARLEASELLTVLHAGQYVAFKGATIYGYGFGERETVAFLDGTAEPVRVKGQTIVALVHASIGASEIADGNEKIRVGAIRDCNIRNAHFACFGDIHTGFEPVAFKYGLKPTAFSPGALCRMRRDEVENVPRVAILDTVKGTVKFYEVPADMDTAFEITDEDSGLPKRDSSASFKDRLAAVTEPAVTDKTDVDLLKEVASENEIDKGVVNAVISEMEKVKL